VFEMRKQSSRGQQSGDSRAHHDGVLSPWSVCTHELSILRSWSNTLHFYPLSVIHVEV
jgi:hypothetical protein